MGDKTTEPDPRERRRSLVLDRQAMAIGYHPAHLGGLAKSEEETAEEQPSTASKIEAFGLNITKEEGDDGEIKSVKYLWCKSVEMIHKSTRLEVNKSTR